MISEKDYNEIYLKGYEDGKNDNNNLKIHYEVKPSFTTRKIKELQQENKKLKGLINTILNFPFFKEECPLGYGFEDNSKEDEAQNIFYSDEYCENTCNNNYKDCWLKYFKELQEIEQGSDE